MIKSKLLLLFLLTTSLKLAAQTVDTVNKNKDLEFITGSKIEVASLTPLQTNNLTVLGKIWGFLKYYHPAVGKGNYNWDFELFRVTPKILAAKTDQERNKVLFNWISALGTFKTSEKVPVAKGNIKYKPNFSWFKSNKLSPEIISLLNTIQQAERREENYYVKLYDAETPIAIFKNEADYSSLKYPDAGYRLLALFKFWNIYEYFSPYKNLTDKPWSGILNEYITKLISAKNELEYKLIIAALVAETKDSHSDISTLEFPLRSYFGIYSPNVVIDFVAELPVVSYSKDEGTIPRSLKKGDVIQQINGVPVAKLIKEKSQYITASNRTMELKKLSALLLRTKDTLLRVTFMRDKKIDTIELKCHHLNRMYYGKPLPADTGFRMINPDIAYIHASRIGTRLKSVMPIAINTKAMILDLRTYPKPTSFGWDIGKFLFNEPAEVARYTAVNIEAPGLFTYLPDDYMAHVRIGAVNPSPYKGRVIVLVNEETWSLGELTAMALRAGPNTIIVGSQTAGADGSVGLPVSFPGGQSVGFTQIGVYYPNGKETQRIGIVPNVKVKPTIQGIKEDRDEILEKAISLVN
ncbi:S41 family peptidase [Pedobacter metabolipauper]|uniref:C-terminal processing protease CtpA/Prc n=1 Tax=Pedobacter metabolipauper TaxID=425513 RepID=A0A4R6T2A3_9SPHI|nr:S41 family peptidase [Pedobacter metabolipauper]TDQ11828.1 C-terminal processing protease CtpA/Prc [Pedobacter metabolipauper]